MTHSKPITFKLALTEQPQNYFQLIEAVIDAEATSPEIDKKESKCLLERANGATKVLKPNGKQRLIVSAAIRSKLGNSGSVIALPVK